MSRDSSCLMPWTLAPRRMTLFVVCRTITLQTSLIQWKQLRMGVWRFSRTSHPSQMRRTYGADSLHVCFLRCFTADWATDNSAKGWMSLLNKSKPKVRIISPRPKHKRGQPKSLLKCWVSFVTENILSLAIKWYVITECCLPLGVRSSFIGASCFLLLGSVPLSISRYNSQSKPCRP